MAQGAAEGIVEGIGSGLDTIASQLRFNQQQRMKSRDEQADDLSEQIKSIANNIAKVGGKDAPEAQPLIEQLHQTVAQHNALYPAHETPALLQRLKTLTGHRPGTPAPTPDPRAGLTAEGAMSAAPVHEAPKNSILQEMNDLRQTLIASGKTPEEAGASATRAIAEKYKTEAAPEEWKALAGDAGKPFKGEDGKVYQNQANEKGATRRVELTGMPAAALTDETKKKPLEPKINAATGGLDSIVDPNTAMVYTASDMSSAPPEVQKIWNDITGAVTVERKRKQDIEDEKARVAEENMNAHFAQQNKVQETALTNLLAAKDYGEARKVVMTADNDYQDALDRMHTMDKNLVDAGKGDQQAMLSLVANHIGMTLGAQKGARITRAAFDEAVQSAPWLAQAASKWSADGYLSGVTLTPEQMHQMVRLAREKVDVLKDHKNRVEDEYHEALNPRPPKAGANSKTGKVDPVDQQILDLLKGVK